MFIFTEFPLGTPGGLEAEKNPGGKARLGQYVRVRASGKPSALVSCPQCGKVCSLRYHTISDDGAVCELECPYEECGWRDRIKLDGWKR
jgi:hypothetical protein